MYIDTDAVSDRLVEDQDLSMYTYIMHMFVNYLFIYLFLHERKIYAVSMVFSWVHGRRLISRLYICI